MRGAKLKIFVPVLLLLLVRVTQAQEAAPWPPDPADIFAPGVEVIKVEVDRPFWDNLSHLVYVYDEVKDQWNNYSYPDEISEIQVMWDYGRLDNELAVRLKGSYTADNAWLFDPAAGSFRPYSYLCKEPLIGELWAFFVEENDGRSYLCNTENAMRGSPLAVDVEFDVSSFSSQIMPSPDRKWVVFSGQDWTNRSIRFYVYDTHSGQITDLGSDNGGEEVKGIQWLDNNHIVITTGDMASWGGTSYYSADLTQPNSLTFFKNVANDYLMSLHGEPPHYEWLGDDCTLVQFFPAANKREVYALKSGLCTRGLPLNAHSSDRLYETINRDENALPVTITLTRYNPYTGEQSDLFTGEIERVMEIAPDGKHVVLVLDNNGILDTVLDTDRDVYAEMNIERLPSPSLAVLDLETHKVVYEADTIWHWTPDYWHYWRNPDTGMLLNTAIDSGGGPLSNILGLGNNLFVKKHLPYECPNLCSDVLIKLNDGLLSEIEMRGRVESYLPNSQQLLIQDADHAYMIYDLADGTIVPLFSEKHSQNDYRVYIERVVEGNSLSILLNNTIRYTIRIPQ